MAAAAAADFQWNRHCCVCYVCDEHLCVLSCRCCLPPVHAIHVCAPCTCFCVDECDLGRPLIGFHVLCLPIFREQLIRQRVDTHRSFVASSQLACSHSGIIWSGFKAQAQNVFKINCMLATNRMDNNLCDEINSIRVQATGAGHITYNIVLSLPSAVLRLS